MTKYILHGGMAGLACESNDKYYQEIVSSAAEPLKILLVYFAVEKERWAELAEWHKNRFVRQADGRKIGFEVASENAEECARQIGWCNVVYIRGGSTPKLQAQLEKIPNFKELIKGKVVAGSSAGAMVFAKYYYDQDEDNFIEGLDILHVKIMTHYLSTGEYAPTSTKEYLEKLKDFRETLPIYAIPETEFVVIIL